MNHQIAKPIFRAIKDISFMKYFSTWYQKFEPLSAKAVAFPNSLDFHIISLF